MVELVYPALLDMSLNQCERRNLVNVCAAFMYHLCIYIYKRYTTHMYAYIIYLYTFMPHVLHCTKMQSFQETPIVSGKKTMNIHEHLNLNPTYRILSLRNAPFLRVAQEEQKKEVSEEWHRKAQQMADEAYAHRLHELKMSGHDEQEQL